LCYRTSTRWLNDDLLSNRLRAISRYWPPMS